mgnify:CR=1 FL=1
MATEIGKDTKVKLSLETIISLGIVLVTMTGMKTGHSLFLKAVLQIRFSMLLQRELVRPLEKSSAIMPLG